MLEKLILFANPIAQPTPQEPKLELDPVFLVVLMVLTFMAGYRLGINHERSRFTERQSSADEAKDFNKSLEKDDKVDSEKVEEKEAFPKE